MNKQIEYTFSIENNMIVADYQWYAFPYQFCSAIIYVAPFAIFTKPHTRVHEFSLAFISTFSLLAGILVMCYPADVFVSTIGINIQTMYHHGSQVILGVYVLMYNRHKVNVKFFLKACITFSIAVTIALALNLIAPYFTSETFNMFFISPYYECTLPVLGSIYAILHPMGLYLVFLAIYICAFSLGAFILSGMFYVAYLIYSRIRYSGKVKPVNVVYKKIEIMA